MSLVVKTQEELIAAVPHVLGFKPEESIVVVPLQQGLPTARIDLPKNEHDREEAADVLGDAYSRHARPGSELALVFFTEDRRGAELASQHLATRFEAMGIGTPLRLWADGEQWEDSVTGESGSQNRAAAERIAADTVMSGQAQPAANREALAASLVGDRESISQALTAARAAASGSTPSGERDWALVRLEQFHNDGTRFTDVDGARMLVALETISTRDSLWEDMSRENTTSHIALWTDLTRRAPDEVRAAPASMLSFASWLHGDGAKGWCALDQVPVDRPYSMAALVASALQNAVPPRTWDEHQSQMCESGAEVDESFVPRPTAPPRDVPGNQPGPDRPGSGR